MVRADVFITAPEASCFTSRHPLKTSRRLKWKSPLHILHLEDDPNDAALVQATLAADGITCATTCVSSRDDFVAALEHGGIDLIFSDFTLPRLTGCPR